MTSPVSMRRSFVSPSSKGRYSITHISFHHSHPDCNVDKRPQLSRIASLPMHVKKSEKKKRGSGLFESSDSSSTSANEDEKELFPTSKPIARIPSQLSSEDSTSGTRQLLYGNDRMNSAPERKGLFEQEDDADSVENLRERVKMRQKKKESEIMSLKQELDHVNSQLLTVNTDLLVERQEKEEFGIRMKECQRIIEKRNKQLIKASEKMARLTEQHDAQLTELHQEIATLKASLTKTQDEAQTAQDQQRVQYEAQIERMSQMSTLTLEEKNMKERSLLKRVKQLEHEVVSNESRVMKSDAYLVLLKRCEDAEAISRGLRFQLEKAQQETKAIKNQLTVQASLPSMTAVSPTSSATSVDLSNFDFVSTSLPSSPSRHPDPLFPTSPVASSTPAPPVEETTPPLETEDTPESLFGTVDTETDLPMEHKRPSSGSINFFEKLSIKFKRTSPRPSVNVKTVDDTEIGEDGVEIEGSTMLSPSMTDATGLETEAPVLTKRPQMYVAKEPSDYEESSDSIFGSDSDSDSESDSDAPPPPPDHPTVKPPSPHLFEEDSDNADSSSPDEVEHKAHRTHGPKRKHTRSRLELASSESDSSASDHVQKRRVPTPNAEGTRRHRFGTDDTIRSTTSTTSKDRAHSTDTNGSMSNSTPTHAKGSRMNEYMEARASKRQAKLQKRKEEKDAEHKQREEYEKEWERMAQEERERRRKQQQKRRTGKRRPSSMKTVRVSQMRQQMNKQKEVVEDVEGDIPRPSPHPPTETHTSSDSEESPSPSTPVEGPPLPPEPTAVDNDLYLRQQARLRERHELEQQKKWEAEEADQIRGQIHRKVEMWAYGKEFVHMILTLDQITTNPALTTCQLMVVQSPDPDTLKKVYRYVVFIFSCI